jgi:hypothetical protein
MYIALLVFSVFVTVVLGWRLLRGIPAVWLRAGRLSTVDRVAVGGLRAGRLYAVGRVAVGGLRAGRLSAVDRVAVGGLCAGRTSRRWTNS